MRFFTVPIFFVCILSGALFAPTSAHADSRCNAVILSATGYSFASFHSTEYINGLLRIHFHLLPLLPHDDGGSAYAMAVVFGDSCWATPLSADSPPSVVFTPKSFSYSLRMTSPTHWVLWDDDNDVESDCTDCSGDITGNLAYFNFIHVIFNQLTTIFSDTFRPTSSSPQKCCDSVLFLPGITGSRLYRPGPVLSDVRLWEPMLNSNVEQLALNPDGSSVNPDVYVKAGDVIGQVYAPFGPDIYASFLGELDTLKGSGTIADFEAVPYDWRLSFDDILTKGAESGGRISYTSATDTPYITQELKRLAAGSRNGESRPSSRTRWAVWWPKSFCGGWAMRMPGSMSVGLSSSVRRRSALRKRSLRCCTDTGRRSREVIFWTKHMRAHSV